MQKNTNYMVIIHSAGGANNPSITVRAPLPEEFMFDSQNSYEAPFAQGLDLGGSTVKNILSMAGVRLATPMMTAQLWQGSSETQLSIPLEFYTENDPIADIRTPILDLLRLTTPSVNPNTQMLQSPGPSIEPSMENLKSMAGAAGGSALQTALDLGVSVAKATGFDIGSMMNPNQSTVAGNGSATPTANPTPSNLGSKDFWKQYIKNQITLQIGNYLYFDSVVITGVQQTFVSTIDAETGWPHHVKVNISFKPLFMMLQSDLDQMFVKKQTNSCTADALGGMAQFFGL